MSARALVRLSKGGLLAPTAVLRYPAAPTKERFNFNTNPFDRSAADPDEGSYPLLSAEDVASYRAPPRKVRMLAREFVHAALYNPHWGYFSTQAKIVDFAGPAAAAEDGFDFGKIRNGAAFEDEVARRYEAVEKGTDVGGSRQVWHTPVELFKPWYARAVARYLVRTYKLSEVFPYQDLLIIEPGGGNGTLMRGILDYLAEEEPEVYERTRYVIVEISKRLGEKQRRRAGPHRKKVEVVHKNILDWTERVEQPCFFLALEVLDNMPHDLVRYTALDHTPLQAVVSISSTGDFSESFTPVLDPLLRRFLAARSSLSSPSFEPPLNPLLARSPTLRKVAANMPLAPNLVGAEWVPTSAFRLLEVLRDYMPGHKLLMADFDALPDAIEGKGAPVVQTRYQGETVPVSTYLVQPGFFDIFYPTNFSLLASLHSSLMSRLPGSQADFFSPLYPSGSGKKRRQLRALTAREFLEMYAETGRTRLKDGSNPMLEWFENQRVLF